jgi:hypothetical protein
MDSINLHIVFSDGTEADVSAIASDMVAFERHFDLSIAKLADEVRMEHLFFLAWHSQTRTKVTGLEFDEWLDTVQIVTSVEPKK